MPVSYFQRSSYWEQDASFSMLFVLVFFCSKLILTILCWFSQGDTQSYFDLVTFRSITSVLNNGVTKQLEFEDLLQLPTDMDPCSCHDALLSCWQSQQSSFPDPSLFRAICSAYGWPYLRLGLLKVLFFCRWISRLFAFKYHKRWKCIYLSTYFW